ncbi:MAG: multidrug ABC transporter permease [Clostridiales bacterium]|nr:multidrug ABC transporter permease [Clostridiales bacterium]
MESVKIIKNKIVDGSIREFLQDWKWIFTFSRRHRGAVLVFTILGLLSSTFSLAAAYVSSIVINIVVEHQTEKLPFLIIAMVSTAAGSIALSSVNRRISAKISVNVNNDIQQDIFASIMDVKWSELNKYKRGDLLARFNSDVSTISTNAVAWIPNILITLYSFVLTLVLLIRMDHWIALIAFSTTPVLVAFSRLILKKQKKYRKMVLENKSDMVSFETEAFYNMDTVKAFGVGDSLLARLKRRQEEYKKTNLAYNMFSIKTGIGVSIAGKLVEWGTYAYCVWRLWNGQILYGDMTFFISQRRKMTDSFDSLISKVPEMLNSAVSAHRIKEIIDLPREEHDPAAFSAFSGKALSLEMNDVSFAYSDGRAVYENAGFSVSPGEIVAVLGESGAGKTTLFRLLLGLVEPGEGQVLLRDKEGNTVPMNADLRQVIAYVPQGNTMMGGTIAENMRLIKPDATDEQIIAALKTACAWDYVEPIGLNAELGESGRGLSEGQLQRISIARALLRDAPVLLLDEATSALDEDTENRVIDSIMADNRERAVIVCTHRPSVLRMCSRVYRIRHRTITEEDAR